MPAPPADELELTKHVVSFLNKRVLHDTAPLDLRDIERCHFVGKAVLGRSRQIIVKFCHYQDKKRVFAGKSRLKGNPAKIFLTEDLTSVNHSVVKSLLPLKKNESIDSFWTSNGQIYVKKDSTSDPVKVSSTDDLTRNFFLPTETLLPMIPRIPVMSVCLQHSGFCRAFYELFIMEPSNKRTEKV